MKVFFFLSFIGILFVSCNQPSGERSERSERNRGYDSELRKGSRRDGEGNKINFEQSPEKKIFGHFEGLKEVQNQINLSGKHALIFFGSQMDLGTKRIENNYLTDSDLLKALSKYDLYKVYIDEGTVIGKNGIEKKGKYLLLQEEVFRTNEQPYLVVIGQGGEIVKEFLGTPRTRHELIEFINK